MMRLIFLMSVWIAIFLTGCASTVGPVSVSPVNLVPMYGYPSVQRTAEEKKEDEKRIVRETASGQSREQSSKKWVELGWKYRRQGLDDNAMRSFNIAWLMNPSN
ncbi:hypothetical protein [Leptothrix ochracea]|uniref:hypothetical protein n=1 Tax=Leptothrix ochracea TaxID=735331 RepID=UPI0034E28D14